MSLAVEFVRTVARAVTSQPVVPQPRLVMIGRKVRPSSSEEGNLRIAVVGDERDGFYPVVKGVDGITTANETFLANSDYITSAARGTSWKVREPEELTAHEYNLLQLFDCSALWQDRETFRLREGAEIWAEFKINVEGGKPPLGVKRDDRIVGFSSKQPEPDNTTNGVKSVFVKLSVSNENKDKKITPPEYSKVSDKVTLLVQFDKQGNVVGLVDKSTRDSDGAKSVELRVADLDEAREINAARQGIVLKKEVPDPNVRLLLARNGHYNPEPSDLDYLLATFNIAVKSHNQFKRE